MMTCARALRGGGALGPVCSRRRPVGVLARRSIERRRVRRLGGGADGRVGKCACGEVRLWRRRRDMPGQQAKSVPWIRHYDETETDSHLLNRGV